MHTESESVLQFLQGLLVTMVSVVSQVRVLRHAGLGRPAGHADTPLDDQQAMLILPWTTSRPCWDSMLFYAIFRA